MVDLSETKRHYQIYLSTILADSDLKGAAERNGQDPVIFLIMNHIFVDVEKNSFYNFPALAVPLMIFFTDYAKVILESLEQQISIFVGQGFASHYDNTSLKAALLESIVAYEKAERISEEHDESGSLARLKALLAS